LPYGDDALIGEERGEAVLGVGERREIGVADAEVEIQRLRDAPGVVHEQVKRVLFVIALEEAALDLGAGSGTDDGGAARVGGIAGEEIGERALLRTVGRV